jgi:hypothetical protein
MKKMEDSIADSIELIKNSKYKGTAIKVELEANLDRVDSDNGYCRTCDSDGYYYCDNCNDGVIPTFDEAADTYIDVDCGECGGQGRIDCEECPAESSYEFSDEDTCKDYMEDRVSPEARKALVYSQFYNDGSVDSEYTFTVKLKDIKYIPEFIKAFKMLADENGNGMDVDGAGMHIAILNSKDGNYPEGNSLNDTYAKNFANSMTHLLPALYFLGSSDHRSRGLGYRKPQIGLRDKYSAITGHMGVFEYRVFETCYDRPEAIFDFIAVVAKSLQFYAAKEVQLDWFGKIGAVGFKDGHGLDRLYYTSTHLKALKAGLKVLKPDYKTVDQLFKERNFSVTAKKIQEDRKKDIARWRSDWREVKERTKYAIEAQRSRARAEWLDCCSRESRAYVETNIGSMEKYIADSLASFNRPRTLAQYMSEQRTRLQTQGVHNTVTV